MISPVFVVQLSTFMFSNISMHLMLNVVNDLMMRSDNVMKNETSFEKIQQQFDLSRGALGIVLPPLCGLINEASSACFQFCVENYFNFEIFSIYFLNIFKHFQCSRKKKDLQSVFAILICQALAQCLVTGSILVNNVWFFLIMQPVLFSIMLNAFITGVTLCYPSSVRATFLSLGNVGSMIFMFIQEPIMKQIKVYKSVYKEFKKVSVL